MNSFVQISTTCDNREVLQNIGDQLVSQRLAACVQIGGPISSIYWWNDQVERGEEWICQAKTTQSLSQRVEDVVRQHHSYDEPEIIVTPIVGGSPGYLRWLSDQVANADDGIR